MEREMINSLLKIKDITQLSSDEHLVQFTIDPTNDLFRGHFPNQPVLPGVVMVEIVRQSLQKISGDSVQLSAASNIKFLKLLVPNTDEYSLKMKIQAESDTSKITAQIFQGEEIYFKQSAVYVRK